jgi:methylase of polypeptide subunit release factors
MSSFKRSQAQAIRTYTVGSHTVAIACRGDVLSPTPYTLMLANHIPPLDGGTAVDVGTGCGILAVLARLQGAHRVYVSDINAEAVAVAVENAARNEVAGEFFTMPAGDTMLQLPAGILADFIICNPAQLPMPPPQDANDPFYAGPDGRRMIEALVREAPARLAPAGRLLMTHNSLTDVPTTTRLMESVGLEPRILAGRSIEFRPFIDRAWLDNLGGIARGLYQVRDGRPYETLLVIEARLGRRL